MSCQKAEKMESLKYLLQERSYISVAVVATASAYILYRQFLRGPKKPKIKNPPNKVVLYQIPRGPYAPNLSPFAVKLETYLRMANIPYVNDFTSPFSSKGKTPWISYNGEPVADSQFSIEYLNKKFDVDLNQQLSKEQKAVAKAIQILVDEHLYWPFVYFRWVYNSSQEIVKIYVSTFVRWMIKRNIKGVMYGQGIGRHTPEEIRHIMMTDLQVLADFLGAKPFMMGDVPSETDCAVFGMLSQFEWQVEGLIANVLQDQFPTLHQYCLRMKEKFWPDWDECITNGGKKKATK